MPALAIREDLTATALRRLARSEPDRRAAMRLLAIANALEGLSRAEAARLAGMERQALRDAVLRYIQCRRSGGPARPAPLGSAGGADAGTAGRAQGLGAARPRPGARRGERLAGGRHPRPCRGGLRRALQRVGHGAALEAAGSLAPEGSTPASAGQRGRAGRVQKRSLGRSSRISPPRIRTPRSSSGARMRPASARRAGSATAGTSAASVRPAWPTSASTASTCSPPAGPARTRPSPSPCPRRPPRAWPCSWRASPESSGPACTRR
jgi:hypothetical protein